MSENKEINFDEVRKFFIDLERQTREILDKKHPSFDWEYPLMLYMWPQAFGGTNPFGPGGNTITSHQVIGIQDPYHGDGVLFLLGRKQYVDKFKMGMNFKI